MSPHTIAVIVNWNSREDTLACLAALARGEGAGLDVIVVDNASTDGSAAAVRGAFPAVEVIENARNVHFARGANQGIVRALARGADYVWVLNPDTTPAPGALAEMLRVAERDAGVGIVGARLVQPKPHPQSRAGERVTVGGNCDLRTGDIIEPDVPGDAAPDRLAVDYVWGCAMLLRAAMLRQVGGFDERLVAYYEDTDLCLRARAGHPAWQTVTALRAVVVHIGARAANRKFVEQMWLRGRNWLWCFWRHAAPGDRPRLLLWMLGYRLPRFAWTALLTAGARTLRPLGRPIKLWG
jgi:GT2 family glycosyltransferase